MSPGKGTGLSEQRLSEVNSFQKWSPQLLAACATILVVFLAQQQKLQWFSPSSAEVGLTSAITVVVAALLNRWLGRVASFMQFFITLGVTLGAVIGLAFALYVFDTASGRSAAAQAMAWRPIKIASVPQGKTVSAGRTTYGTGYAWESKGEISIHIDSSKSNLISWFPTLQKTSSTYYARVDERLKSGSAATACVLVFAYRNINSFFQLALRSDGLQLAYWDGQIPARAYEGPTAVPFAQSLNVWHALAVSVHDQTITAFVDDRKVFSDYVDQPLFGSFTFGTLDIGSGYTDDATCEFRQPMVRSLY